MVNSISSSGQASASTGLVEEKDTKKNNGTSWKVVSAFTLTCILGAAAATYFHFNPLQQEAEAAITPSFSERLSSNIAYILPSSFEDVITSAAYVAPALSLIIRGKAGFRYGYDSSYKRGEQDCERALKQVLNEMGVVFGKTLNSCAKLKIDIETPYLLLKKYNYIWLNDKIHFLLTT